MSIWLNEAMNLNLIYRCRNPEHNWGGDGGLGGRPVLGVDPAALRGLHGLLCRVHGSHAAHRFISTTAW